MEQQVPQIWFAVVVIVMSIWSCIAIWCALRQKQQRMAYCFLASHALLAAIGFCLFMMDGLLLVAASCWALALSSFFAAAWQFAKGTAVHVE